MKKIQIFNQICILKKKGVKNEKIFKECNARIFNGLADSVPGVSGGTVAFVLGF